MLAIGLTRIISVQTRVRNLNIFQKKKMYQKTCIIQIIQ